MSEALPSPMTPVDCDLRDFPHTPIFRARLFGSAFHARANDAEWRAGVTLWLKSWDQVPAGSLPDDEIELCRLAELARDLKTWRKVREGALRGWVLCSDGRLYHPVVAEGINNAIQKKVEQRSRTAKARISALEKHLAKATDPADKQRITDEIRKLRQSLSQTVAPSVTDHSTDDVTSSKRREGEGKGISLSEANASGGAAPPPASPPAAERRDKPRTPAEEADAHLWASLKAMFVEAKAADDVKAAGVLLGGMASKYGKDVFREAGRTTVDAKPVDPHTYLVGLCETAVGKRPGLGQRATSHTGLTAKNPREGVTPDGSFA